MKRVWRWVIVAVLLLAAAFVLRLCHLMIAPSLSSNPRMNPLWIIIGLLMVFLLLVLLTIALVAVGEQIARRIEQHRRRRPES